VNVFVDVAASPLGDLYGIQSYKDGRTDVQYAYKFDFNSGTWNIFDSQNQVSAMRFDKMGNIYTLDRKGNVAANRNNAQKILSGVTDFEINVNNQIYAIGASASTNAYTHLFDSASVSPFTYKMFPQSTFNAVGLANQVPVFRNANNTLRGYGNQCVQDFSFGVDGELWAISCDQDPNNTANYQIIKWDPFLNQWYLVRGRTGVKISAYNEISAAVLSADGLIWISSDTGDKYLPQYSQRNISYTSFLNNSVILDQEGANWLKNNLLMYNTANLVYRATRDGFLASVAYNSYVNKGPILHVYKTAGGLIVGGYLSTNSTANNAWVTDGNSFIYQTNNKLRQPVQNSYSYIQYNGYIGYWGNGADLYVPDKANTSSSTCAIGNGYVAPTGGCTAFTGGSSFMVTEIEIYVLSWQQGTQ